MATFYKARWKKLGEILWRSCFWEKGRIQQLSRGLSTEAKENTKRFQLSFVGSGLLGIVIGYQLHRFKDRRKTLGAVVEAKTTPPNESSFHGSGSPPRSATFNFIADAVEKAAPAVVCIESTARHTGFGFMGHVAPSSSGSGFIVTEDGMVLTNAHVVENAVNVRVKLKDGREYNGTVVDIDLENDLAAVKLNANKVQMQFNRVFIKQQNMGY